MGHYTYFVILVAALAGPLFLSFDKKVHFYKKWKFVFTATIFPALFFIIWDNWFTACGVWSFNPEYVLGIYVFNLPLEEVLFFFVVPYCCLFVYECIRVYFPGIQCSRRSDYLMGALAVLFVLLGFYFHDKMYTAYTFVFNALLIAFILCCRNYFESFHVPAFFIAYAFILLPFLLVNGFLTALPVVLYNDAENTSLRIYTIPAEDIFYGMLLVMMNVAGYERRKTSK